MRFLKTKLYGNFIIFRGDFRSVRCRVIFSNLCISSIHQRICILKYICSKHSINQLYTGVCCSTISDVQKKGWKSFKSNDSAENLNKTIPGPSKVKTRNKARASSGMVQLELRNVHTF